ncbi:MAG: NAD-dependent epimerase/dehydratase family protein [Saprospiraceae bacterium]
MPHILLTGALGQIGRVLLQHLVDVHGADAVLATDLPFNEPDLPCAYRSLDATDGVAWSELSKEFQFKEVYHLVAVLSAKGEANPWRSWDINMDAWRNVIENATQWPDCKVFFPSSIAAYGPPLPAKVDESQALTPTTSYGVSKAAGEMWADYAGVRFGLDVRCLRLPGVIGYQTMPGGGTTDYAVDIYHQALKGEMFTCFLAPDTRLPMIYMADVLRGVSELMAAPREVLAKAKGNRATAIYNLDGFSVTPAELHAEIQKHLPDFQIEYAPDFRQEIAETWPQELDGKKARETWSWQPNYDLASTTEDMLTQLRKKKPSSTSTLKIPA